MLRAKKYLLKDEILGSLLIPFKTLESMQTRHKAWTPQEYQYLERTSLPTYKFQRSLPRLPIPELSKTCNRYLEAIKPIIESKEQLNKTEKIVKEFESGAGVELNSQLNQINKKNKHTSYISKPWFDYYLKSRLPLPLNFNPFMVWKDDSQEYCEQSLKVSNIIVSAMRFRRSLIDEVLSPEVFHLNAAKSNTKLYKNIMRLTPSAVATYVSYTFKAFPLDMSQFSNLFASTRIPRLERDQLVTYPNSKHVVIMRNGNFYSFDILDCNGNLRDSSDILTNVKYITSLPNISDDNSISMLTTDDRDIWAKARAKLVSMSLSNQQNIELIDSAQFIVCLDDTTISDDLIKGAHNFLHGYSKANNFVNRWFDKSFSVIVTKHGNSAINFEHSWGDGVAVLRFFNEIYNDSFKKHILHPNSQLNQSIDPSKEVRKLDFQLNDELKNSIKESRERFRKNIEPLELNYLLYDRMNRNYFKNKKVSPDSMFQLAFQMAYYRINNKFCATYESCSTSAFKHGRTETVRPATNATKAASEAVLKDKSKNWSHLRNLLNDCSIKHSQLTKEAAMGQGFDRHLFAMKTLAQQSGKVPEIFTDKSYIEANHYILSTSSLSTDAFQGGGFAPVVNNGFGCAYSFLDNISGLFLSSYKPHTDGKQFINAIIDSLNDINEILEKS